MTFPQKSKWQESHIPYRFEYGSMCNRQYEEGVVNEPMPVAKEIIQKHMKEYQYPELIYLGEAKKTESYSSSVLGVK